MRRAGEWWRACRPLAEVTASEFLSPKWQLRHSLKDPTKIASFLESASGSKNLANDFLDSLPLLPMTTRVTPHTMACMDFNDPNNCVIRRQFIPLASELAVVDHPMTKPDALAEQASSPVHGLVHRYPDKALFLPLSVCPTYCRFCTRSYGVGMDAPGLGVRKQKLPYATARWQQCFNYLANDPTGKLVKDVVVSGGDSAMLSAKYLRVIGQTLLDLPHIERVRFASKALSVMPMKVTGDSEWLDALTWVKDYGRERFKHVCLHTHINHPNEITPETEVAMRELFEREITVRNQAVLLRGCNDDVATMKKLVIALGRIQISSYYVFAHDMVPGVEDLRTSLDVVLRVEKETRGVTAGFNTPVFVVDLPGGGGKRDAHSYEHYDRRTGISVFSSPSVAPQKGGCVPLFMHFDPLHSLEEEVQGEWLDPVRREAMLWDAEDAARKRMGPLS